MVANIGIKAEKYRWLGTSRYTILSLLEIIFKKTNSAKITYYDENNKKNQLKDKFMFAVLCNTIHTGKGMKIAPKAKLDDGLLDLIVVPETQIFKLLTMFPKIFDGSHLGHEVLQYYQVKEFSLKPSINESLNLDGEVYGKTPIDVSVIKHGLSIYA